MPSPSMNIKMVKNRLRRVVLPILIQPATAAAEVTTHIEVDVHIASWNEFSITKTGIAQCRYTMPEVRVISPASDRGSCRALVRCR